MLSKKRRITAAAVLVLGLLIGLASTRSIASKRQERMKFYRVLQQVNKLAHRFAPNVTNPSLEVEKFITHTTAGDERSVWTVQISDENDEYAGVTTWDVETGELKAASWITPKLPFEEVQGLSIGEVRDIARLRLDQLDVATDNRSTRILGRPIHARQFWTVWCGTSTAHYRLKVDSVNGRLVTAERREKLGQS